MSAWNVDAEPADCPWLAALVCLAHLAMALLPWAAGCHVLLAAPLSLAGLAALPRALRAVPGRRCPLRRLRCAGGQWRVGFRDGTEQAVEIVPTTRVLAAVAFCRLAVGGRKLDWWIPRSALDPAGFRRCKVALRCAGPGSINW